MPYSEGARLPAERASKLGHLAVVQSDWVKSLVEDFESTADAPEASAELGWQRFDVKDGLPLKTVWATDGSLANVATHQRPPKEVGFVKTALLLVDRARLAGIDKDLPHPLLLQDLMADSAVFHSTVFPLRNIRTSRGSNYDAIRHIVRDSLKIDQAGAFYETFKWLAFASWSPAGAVPSPGFECPHCHHNIVDGLPPGVDERKCPKCSKLVFLSDLWGFHLDMDEDSAPDSISNAYMAVMEHLMLFTAVRLLWQHSDKSLVSDALFLKDGPLTLRGQYSKMVPTIRAFLEYAKQVGRPVHVAGQEKTGAFVDHLLRLTSAVPPHEPDGLMAFKVLDHAYVRREVYHSPDLANPYGKRTNWGEKVLLKVHPGCQMVLSIPTGNYLPSDDRPAEADLIGLRRILATIPSVVSHRFEGALFPIELANGVASMSSYPSATILTRFLEGTAR